MNGVVVGRNRGGYLPFTCDVTDALEPGNNTLVVRVRDLSDGRGPSSGKQRLDRGNIWYTAQSGIWQTVWAEAVPATYVEQLTLTLKRSRDRLAALETQRQDIEEAITQLKQDVRILDDFLKQKGDRPTSVSFKEFVLSRNQQYAAVAE